MLSGRRAQAIPPHPDEAALGRLAEDGGEDAAVQAHVADCPRCTARVAELRRIRTLVREAALREEMPERDLAGGALARLWARRRIGTPLNEALEGFSAFLRNLATLFSHPDAHRDAPGGVHPPANPVEEERHE